MNNKQPIEDLDIDDKYDVEPSEIDLEKERIKEEQDYQLWEQSIKELYARLYGFGFSKEKVKSKIDKISMFFGHLGAASELSTAEIGYICQMLEMMKLEGFKFQY